MDKIEVCVTPAVRQYSFKFHQENPRATLSQALESEVKRHDAMQNLDKQQVHDWKTWLISRDDLSDETFEPLQHQSKVLIDMWRKVGPIPLNETESGAIENVIPTVGSLYNAVKEAQVAWDAQQRGRFRRTKAFVLAFAEKLDNYSFLFHFIPASDKYISLITGVVTSIVKVSVNHQKIADAFSLALVQISYYLELVQKKVDNFNSVRMRHLLVDLSVDLFGFLCCAVSWYTSKRKRFQAAINKSFYERTFKPTVDKIQMIVECIFYETQHISEVLGGETHGMVKQVLHTLQEFGLRNAGNMNRHDDSQQIFQKFADIGNDLFNALGSSSMTTLRAVEDHIIQSHDSMLDDNLYADGHSGSTSSSEVERLEANNEVGLVDESDVACTRIEIEQLTGRLSQFAEDGRYHVSDALRGVVRAHLPAEVMIEFKRWITATESRTMWVEGPPSSSHGSGLSLAAMRISDISLDSGIPCISIFIKARYDFTALPGPPIAQREASTVALLYSVIYQLIRLLPAEFEHIDELAKEQFDLLDGRLESANIALRIIEALISHSPPSLIFIIDGLQLAESQKTIHHLSDLIRILRSQEKRRMLKVCFTTNGNSMVLIKKTGVFERVDASRMSQESPWGFLRGAFDIGELGGHSHPGR